MDKIKIIDLTPENIADYGVCGYKDINKHEELRNKINKLDLQLVELLNERARIVVEIGKLKNKNKEQRVLGWKMGLEPTTFGTTIRRSNRLNYIHRFRSAK